MGLYADVKLRKFRSKCVLLLDIQYILHTPPGVWPTSNVPYLPLLDLLPTPRHHEPNLSHTIHTSRVLRCFKNILGDCICKIHCYIILMGLLNIRYLDEKFRMYFYSTKN